nr:hypothetical protein K-LCC10_0316 [Kaumoebavirus]
MQTPGFYTYYFKSIPMPVVVIDDKRYVMAAYVKLFVNDVKLANEIFKVRNPLKLDAYQLMILQTSNYDALVAKFGYDTEFWSTGDVVEYLLLNTLQGNRNVRYGKKMRLMTAHKTHRDLIGEFPRIELEIHEDLEILCPAEKRKRDEEETLPEKRRKIY